MNKNNIFPSAIILAAGLSERMGKHKALLAFNDNTNFVQHIAESMIAAGCNNIIVVTNPVLFNFFNENNILNNTKIKIVVNDKPELGRFRSIKIGLKMIGDNNVFIHNCDNPFCSHFLLKDLFLVLNKKSYVVPLYNDKGGHPILLSKFICNYLLKIEADDVNLKKILSQFIKKEVITTDNKILFNVNTPEDYNTFVQIQKLI